MHELEHRAQRINIHKTDSFSKKRFQVMVRILRQLHIKVIIIIIIIISIIYSICMHVR